MTNNDNRDKKLLNRRGYRRSRRGGCCRAGIICDDNPGPSMEEAYRYYERAVERGEVEFGTIEKDGKTLTYPLIPD